MSGLNDSYNNNVLCKITHFISTDTHLDAPVENGDHQTRILVNRKKFNNLLVPQNKITKEIMIRSINKHANKPKMNVLFVLVLTDNSRLVQHDMLEYLYEFF